MAGRRMRRKCNVKREILKTKSKELSTDGRAAARAKFEAQINADLTTCKETAAKAKEDFIIAHQQPVRRKPGQFTIPQAAVDEADKNLEAANAACQTTYETHLKNGS